MAPQIGLIPKVVGFLGADVGEDDCVVHFACDDGKQYSLPISLRAVGSVIDGLGRLNLPGRLLGALPTLTVESSKAAARPDGSRALLLTTKEEGTIAFALSDQGIGFLLRDLTEMQRVAPASSTKQ
jgi:hypothetical protein